MTILLDIENILNKIQSFFTIKISMHHKQE